ncbi:MAG: EFR1 family ferrodoxin [Lachnospiraceae bacterium]|nr:EFR1 family ferrodoxin [Lachnospiraceae bacterium]
MIGIYFSGTGNTRFCVEYLLQQLETDAKAYSIEAENVSEQIKKEQEIILGYPIYYSNLPKILNDFIIENKDLWMDKKIYLVATMGLFSGDGAGVAARQLKKYGAKITGGLHLAMPDCICDEKVLKKTLEKNRAMVNKSKVKIEAAANRYKEGRPTKEGLNLFYHMAGLLGQRLYFYNKTKNYTDKLKINKEKCIGCGKCAGLCPMKNITIEEKKAISHESCTMCYRCINNCPVQAITLLGDKVVQQSVIEKYL